MGRGIPFVRGPFRNHSTLRVRFSIRSVLLLTMGTAGLLAVLVRPGPVSAGAAGLLWLVAGGLAGALDFRTSRGVGALRGPAFSGVLAGALAGLILAAIGMAAVRAGRPQLFWPGPGLAFYGYWWISTGAIVGGILGCLVARRRAGAFKNESHGVFQIDDARLPMTPASPHVPRITWAARWRAWWCDSPSWFASAHLHVVVWTLLSVRAFGLGSGVPARPMKPKTLDSLLVTWTQESVQDFESEKETGPTHLPPQPAVAPKVISNLPPTMHPSPSRAPSVAESSHGRRGGGLVHVVGLYEGNYPTGVRHKANFHPQGNAEVHVTSTAAPTVLVLCSYEPVKWIVRVGPGAVVERVILSGYHHQDVAGIPEGVPISSDSYDDRSKAYYYAYERDHEDYPSLAQGVRKATGMEVATFQGSYAYSGRPIVVGPESETWGTEYRRYLTQDERRAEQAAAQRVARQAIGNLSFQGIWQSEKNGRRTSAFGSLTLDGPVENTLREIPNLRVVAIDPEGLPLGPRYYAIRNHSVVDLDESRHGLSESRELVIPPALPELSWPCGLTFDTKRGRLILASLGGSGYLYALDRGAGKWSLLADLKNVDLGALAYSEKDDVLYGIDNGPGGGTIHTLRKFSPQGKLLSTVKISEPIPMQRHTDHPQLFAVGGQVVILGARTPMLDVRNEPLAHPIAVVDPASGRVLWSGAIPSKQPPELPEEK